MGNKRYSSDEEKFDNKNINIDSDINSTYSKRSVAINGYKKIMIVMSIFTFICCFRANVIDRIIVSGNSMKPTLNDGDVLWAKKFNVEEISRYQIVVARVKGKLVIKRVIGLPNETIQFIDGYVYIGNERLKKDYGNKTSFYGCATDIVLLGDNEYFLLGDNRDESVDSRVWGAINIKNIRGIIVFKFFPFWKIIE